MKLFQTIKRRSKNYFLSGILVVIPIVITIFVVKAIFTFLDELLLPYLMPHWVTGFRGSVLLLLLLVFI